MAQASCAGCKRSLPEEALLEGMCANCRRPGVQGLTLAAPVERKYVPTLAELIDRLSILTLKEVLDAEHKSEWRQEKAAVLHDIDAVLATMHYLCTGQPAHSPYVHAIVVLAQMNAHIWYNEARARRGEAGGDLRLTHGLNGIRNTAKNRLATLFGERKDHKVDCLAADFKDWEIEW